MPADPDPNTDTDTPVDPNAYASACALIQRLRAREAALVAEANDLRSQLRDERRLRHDAEAIIDERQDEIGRLEAVVEEQREVLERLVVQEPPKEEPTTEGAQRNAPDPAQQPEEPLQKEVLRLTGVVCKQDLEIDRLKDVISTQKEEIDGLAVVVESLERDLKGTQETLDDVLVVQEAVADEAEEAEEEEEEEEGDLSINNDNDNDNDHSQNIEHHYAELDHIATSPRLSGPEFRRSFPTPRSLHDLAGQGQGAGLEYPFDADYAVDADGVDDDIVRVVRDRVYPAVSAYAAAASPTQPRTDRDRDRDCNSGRRRSGRADAKKESAWRQFLGVR